MRCFRSLALLLLLITLEPSSHGLAEGPWRVARATNDRNVDLVEALIDQQRFADALTVCQRLARGVDPTSDAAAKWAINQSRVLVARQMGRELFAEDIDEVAKPVNELLNAYPEHRRRLFLLAQTRRVGTQAALHQLLRAAVSPSDLDARNAATKALLRATESLESLIRDVNEARILLDQRPEDRPSALVEDLTRLQQELQIETVSLALMQTELFAPGADDRIAAATRAEQIADQTIARLPSDTKARREVERLRIESILRAAQYDRADREMAAQLTRQTQPLDDRWGALQVRLDLAQQRYSSAAERLKSYYGDDPESAPRSIEMDLARFEFLLRSDSSRSSGDWLEVIQRRGGDYARRRAEAVALSLLGRSEKPNETIDPAIVAAQGQDYLRRGDPQRAAELLAAAARAETNQDRAVSRAAEAAAAFGLVQRHQQAAAVLSEIAVANPDATQAAAAHLQAAVLIASHAPQQAEQLEAILRSNLKRWPDAETAAGARGWLQKILAAQERQMEAAEVASDISPDRIDAEALDGIEQQWRLVFRTAETRGAEVSRRFLEAFEPLLVNPDARSRFVLLAALLVDRGQLSEVKLDSASQSADPFAAALLEFRRSGSEAQPLQSPRPEIIDDATDRLMRDGRENPAQRPAIARVLEGWPGNDRPSLDRAERLLWLDRTRDAIDLVKQVIQADPGSADATRQSARLLQQSRDPLAIAEAIRLWDQLASGTPRGSSLWHEAKLAAISALRQSGKVEEARQRARYLLLTMPTMDEPTRSQYESLSK